MADGRRHGARSHDGAGYASGTWTHCVVVWRAMASVYDGVGCPPTPTTTATCERSAAQRTSRFNTSASVLSVVNACAAGNSNVTKRGRKKMPTVQHNARFLKYNSSR
jgi:hypothetical protein